MNSEKNNMSLVDDLKNKKEEEQQEKQTKDMMSAMESVEYAIDEDDTLEEQVQNLHGDIVMRVLNRAKLMNFQLSQNDVRGLSQSSYSIIEQKILFYILEKIGVESIEEIFPEEAQDELVGLFRFKQDLGVSKDDIPKDLK